MKATIHAITTAAAAVCVVSTLAFAQAPGRGPSGRGMAMHYDAAAETTFSGTVDDVRTMQAQRGMNGMGGLHLMVRTDAGVYEVALGPASFIISKHVEFAKGDAVTITGAKTTMAGNDVVIAREVKKDGNVLTLRDAKGMPLWMGRMRHPS
jgi:hypothetical protein